MGHAGCRPVAAYSCKGECAGRGRRHHGPSKARCPFKAVSCHGSTPWCR